MPVTVTSVVLGGHEDERRTISDIVLPELSFSIVQIKIVKFKAAGVGYLVAGNHYHTQASNRHEFFVVDGPVIDGNPPLIECAYRNAVGETVVCVDMHRGDACLVPPECSHAFRALREGAFLWGFSNIPYDPAHDVRDVIL